MDEITHTILPNNGGLSGTALGAGFGGLIGSWLGNIKFAQCYFLKFIGFQNGNNYL